MPTPPSSPHPVLFSLPAGDEPSCERWPPEMETERLEEVARQLPQAADEAGHAYWQREMAEARLTFERQRRVPSGHRAREVLSIVRT